MIRDGRRLNGSRPLVHDLERTRARYFGGGGGTTQTVQKSDPWSGQQGFLQDIFNSARVAYQNDTPQYYPNSTYVPLTGQQHGLMSGLIDYGANGGNSGLNAANGSVTDTLSPGYTAATGNTFDQANGVLNNELSPGYLNPWNSPSFSTVVGNTLASVLPATTSSFINGGRTDSGAATRAATMAATDAVGNLAQSQYNANQQTQQGAASLASNNLLTQQANQTKAAGLAPLIDQSQVGDLSAALNTAGLTQQDLQNLTNADIQKWNFNQMAPWNNIGLYNSLVQGSYGGTTNTTQPYYSNTAGNVLGGLMGAATLASVGAQAAGYSGIGPAISALISAV